MSKPKDHFRAAAAHVLGKDESEVSSCERSRLKSALFVLLYSPTFLSLQAPYLRDALNRQEEEYNLMWHLAEISEIRCDKCDNLLEPHRIGEGEYSFTCPSCFTSEELVFSRILDVIKNPERGKIMKR